MEPRVVLCETTNQLAAAVGQAHTLDRAACRADCEERFSDHAIVDAYESLYRKRIEAARRALGGGHSHGHGMPLSPRATPPPTPAS